MKIGAPNDRPAPPARRSGPPARRRRLAAAVAVAGTLAALAAVAVPVSTEGSTEGGGVGPDVVLYNIPDADSYSVEDGFAGYALGTDACNRGDQPLEWCDESFGCGTGATASDHPVIAQNLYRLEDGRFEQIGMSWLKHGFSSANEASSGCHGAQGQVCTEPPAGGDQLGIGCTDAYNAFLNGRRPLGRRSEVDATTGVYPFPPSSPAPPYTAYDQRLKVAAADVAPSLNPGAVYIVEAQYVAPDDAAAGNGLNNASHREATFGGPPHYLMALAGTFKEQEPAIFAWPALDPEVELAAVDVPGSSPVERFHVARKTTDLGSGLWHYEYAVHNLNSNRSAQRFTVRFPFPATITATGFHDVEHHSGEPYGTADWTADLSTADEVTWSTDDYTTDPNANALRWSTTFSFWFDATAPPLETSHVLGLYKPGVPDDVTFFITDVIFQDDFESGDLTAWSSTVGD